MTPRARYVWAGPLGFVTNVGGAARLEIPVAWLANPPDGATRLAAIVVRRAGAEVRLRVTSHLAASTAGTYAVDDTGCRDLTVDPAPELADISAELEVAGVEWFGDAHAAKLARQYPPHVVRLLRGDGT